VLAGVQRVEVGDTVNAQDDGSPSMTNCLRRFLNAASVIQGKRLVQS
jgi:hypothetical protein